MGWGVKCMYSLKEKNKVLLLKHEKLTYPHPLSFFNTQSATFQLLKSAAKTKLKPCKVGRSPFLYFKRKSINMLYKYIVTNTSEFREDIERLYAIFC